MRERGGEKRIHMLEYITFSQGKSKTRTSADIYSPLVANCKGLGCLAERAWSDLCSFTKPSVEVLPNHRRCKFSVLTSDTHLCNRPYKCYLIPDKRSHEWIKKTTEAGQNERIEVIESYRQREREKILSFEYCTHYNGPEELCAVKSYAPVKLNKGKVFPHEGQMRISKWKCRQMSKS